MGYIDETAEKGRTVERLIQFMKAVENPSWMIDLVEDMNNKVNMYENLEEQGRLLKLPCAIGDVVYRLYTVDDVVKVYEHRITTLTNIVNIMEIGEIGKTVFLTQEAAESALRELIS